MSGLPFAYVIGLHEKLHVDPCRGFSLENPALLHQPPPPPSLSLSLPLSLSSTHTRARAHTHTQDLILDGVFLGNSLTMDRSKGCKCKYQVDYTNMTILSRGSYSCCTPHRDVIFVLLYRTKYKTQKGKNDKHQKFWINTLL